MTEKEILSLVEEADDEEDIVALPAREAMTILIGVGASASVSVHVAVFVGVKTGCGC